MNYQVKVIIIWKIHIQSSLDIVTLDLREIRYRRQIFGAPAVPMGDIMLSPFEIREFDIKGILDIRDKKLQSLPYK